MNKSLWYLSIFFAILTLVGAGLMLYTRGGVNPWYAVGPLIVSMVCLSAYSTGVNRAKREAEEAKQKKKKK